MSILKGRFAGERSRLRRRLLSLGNTFEITVQKGRVDSLGGCAALSNAGSSGQFAGALVVAHDALARTPRSCASSRSRHPASTDLRTYVDTTINLTVLNETCATTPVIPICTVLRNDFHELSNHLLDAVTFRPPRPPPRSTQICRLR